MTESRKQILVFGGSFDPPHLGHLRLLLAAARTIRPDEILILPAFQAPFKGSPPASVKDRLRMTQLGLLAGLPARLRARARIDRAELAAGRRVYTVESLERLTRLRPGARLHFLAGSDSAASFPLWRQAARLKRLAVWWAGRRPGAAGAVGAHFRRLDGIFPDISSTAIREGLALGQDVSRLLAPRVMAHIRARGLYGLKLLDGLRASLSPERFAHTLAVAGLASSLAARWRLDGERARLAGLLHDCGRAVPLARMAVYARRRGLRVPNFAETARRAPLLLHAYISADLARRRFSVRDSAVLGAVAKHTLGDAGMSELEKLLYVADACSLDRAYPEAERLRLLAFRDLEEAFKACARAKLQHVLSSGLWLHPQALRLWNDLI